MTHRIEHLPLGSIQLAVGNPKRHDLERIKQSIRRFGVAAPALRDERTGTLVAGHGRTIALREMKAAGRTPADKMWPPTGVTLADDGEWRVPVACGWASLNDAEARAYLVADNRHVELGGWDGDALTDILKAVDSDLAAAAGFTGDELAGILAAFDTPVSLPPSMFSNPAAPPAPLPQPPGPPGSPFTPTTAPAGGWPAPNAWPPQPAYGPPEDDPDGEDDVVVHGTVPATGAAYAETPEQEAARAARFAGRTTREAAGTAELTLVFPKDDRDQAVRMIGAAREVLGHDLPNSEVVLRALRVLNSVLDARHDFEPVPVSFFAKLVGAADL